nr:hypothetical protein Iba_chr08dCG9510 [Ipomoea batatas]GMD26998.1 hypothetical protein Iba_chr08dCG9540 [Ipomoea batatas]
MESRVDIVVLEKVHLATPPPKARSYFIFSKVNGGLDPKHRHMFSVVKFAKSNFTDTRHSNQPHSRSRARWPQPWHSLTVVHGDAPTHYLTEEPIMGSLPLDKVEAKQTSTFLASWFDCVNVKHHQSRAVTLRYVKKDRVGEEVAIVQRFTFIEGKTKGKEN